MNQKKMAILILKYVSITIFMYTICGSARILNLWHRYYSYCSFFPG